MEDVCALCGTPWPASQYCPACQEEIEALEACPGCGRSTPDPGDRCPACVDDLCPQCHGASDAPGTLCPPCREEIEAIMAEVDVLPPLK